MTRSPVKKVGVRYCQGHAKFGNCSTLDQGPTTKDPPQ